jgi:hypothetical protein
LVLFVERGAVQDMEQTNGFGTRPGGMMFLSTDLRDGLHASVLDSSATTAKSCPQHKNLRGKRRVSCQSGLRQKRPTKKVEAREAWAWGHCLNEPATTARKRTSRTSGATMGRRRRCVTGGHHSSEVAWAAVGQYVNDQFVGQCLHPQVVCAELLPFMK